MRTLYVDGEAVDDIEPLSDPEGFRVQVEDVGISSGFDPECGTCGEPLVEDDRYPSGYRHDDDDAIPAASCAGCGGTIRYEDGCWAHDTSADDYEPECVEDGTPGPDDDWHEPKPGPFGWCNSAAITFDPSDESVTVSISVGDPRGAFAFQVRRIPDDAHGELAGRLVIHTPYPGEGFAHMETHELRPGTLVVGEPLTSTDG